MVCIMADSIENIETYLTTLENDNKAERLLGAICVLNMLGYNVEWDRFQKRYIIRQEGCQ